MALVKNASDEEQVKEAKRKAGYERRAELSELREILSTVAGRKFIWRYLGVCGVFRSSFSPDVGIYFYEGKRDIGLKMLADVMEADAGALTLMMNESKAREDGQGE